MGQILLDQLVPLFLPMHLIIRSKMTLELYLLDRHRCCSSQALGAMFSHAWSYIFRRFSSFAILFLVVMTYGILGVNPNLHLRAIFLNRRFRIPDDIKF